MILIVPFEKKYAADFKRLNLEWLERFELTEAEDLRLLNNPFEEIINPGGFIWLALAEKKAIGTAALIKLDEQRFELAKMAVTESFQGKGTGRLLLKKCIETARSAAAEEIILFSNSRLGPALRLYEKYGFENIELAGSNYQTADVKMSLKL